MASVYDSLEDTRGVATLGLCASISFVATLAYTPLLRMMPKPMDDRKLEEKDVEEYDAMSDFEWSQQPLEIHDKVGRMKIQAGATVRPITWGTYEQDQPQLAADGVASMHRRFVRDFNYIRSQVQTVLAHRELVTKEMEDFRVLLKQQQETPDLSTRKEEAAKAMGKWMVDYLEDAGYHDWDTQATFIKQMMIGAFPPIDELNGKKIDYAAISPEEYENLSIKFLGVLDEHIHGNKQLIKTHQSMTRSFGAFLRRV